VDLEDVLPCPLFDVVVVVVHCTVALYNLHVLEQSWDEKAYFRLEPFEQDLGGLHRNIIKYLTSIDILFLDSVPIGTWHFAS